MFLHFNRLGTGLISPIFEKTCEKSQIILDFDLYVYVRS